MAIKDLQVKDGAIVRSNIDSNAPTTCTVNGQVNPILTAGPTRPSCCGSPTLVPTSGTGYVSTARSSMSSARTPTLLPKSGRPMSWCCRRARGTTSSSDGPAWHYAPRPCRTAPGPTETTTWERRLATFEVTGDPRRRALANVAQLRLAAPDRSRRSHPERGVQREPEDQPVLHQRQAVQRDQGHLRREAGDHQGVGDQEHRLARNTPSTSMSTTSRSWRSTASLLPPAASRMS